MKGFPLVIVALFIDGLIAGFGLVIWAGFLGLGTTVAGLASLIPYAGPMLGATAGAAVNGAGIGVAFVTSVCINATLGAGFATALPYMYGGTTAQTHRLMTRFLRWMLAKLIPGLGYLPLWTVGTVWFLWDEHKEAKKLAEKGQNISGAEEGGGEREVVPGQISRLSPAGTFGSHGNKYISSKRDT